MVDSASTRVYDDLGVKPVISARGHMTMLGGSSLSPAVLAAMAETGRYYADMAELLDKSGRIVAGLLAAEAAYITPGAAAALALGTAGIMTGHDESRMAQLPDTTGMKRDVLIQKQQRYPYDRCPTIVGGRLVEVGDEAGTTRAQLDAAIGPETATTLYPAHLDGRPGAISLADTLAIAHARGIPVLVDAAGQVYPLEHMRSYAAMGCDLVAYGAKYVGAPNSAGILCGRRELVEAAGAQGFIGFETHGRRAFGRPLKLDRQEIAAVVVALREWMAMDHAARVRGFERRLGTIAAATAGLRGVTARLAAGAPDAVTVLRVVVDAGVVGRTATQVSDALRAESPGIWLGIEGDELVLSAGTLHEGDEEVVARRLREVLSA